MSPLPPFDELPTVRPEDIAWLKTAQPLLTVPQGVGIVEPGPLPLEEVERWLAFFAAAELLGVHQWGARHGAVRTTSFPIEHRATLHGLAAFGRVVVVAVEPEATLGMAVLARAVAGAAHVSARYSLSWSAAVYAAAVEAGLSFAPGRAPALPEPPR